MLLKTRQQLERELAALERDIAHDHKAIDTADAGKASEPAQPTLTAGQLASHEVIGSNRTPGYFFETA